MGREWKPGDVAAAKSPTGGPDLVGIIDVDGRFYTTDQRVKGMSSSLFTASNLRPLVVIDAEDREQVDALAKAYLNARDEMGGQTLVRTLLQAALRTLANPVVKPEEPLGLGAVVEDARGRKWVRTTRIYAWMRTDATGANHWDDLDVVKVLSEGVQS